MPLMRGKSDKAFNYNVATEMKANPGPENRSQNLAIAYAMKRKSKKMNQGGMADGKDIEFHDDLVDRIIDRRYSEGGMVANDTDILADTLPNEFDDLVLRDDLTSTYGEDNNSGDESGDSQEDHDRADIVARIMKSRSKKDRNPRPA